MSEQDPMDRRAEWAPPQLQELPFAMTASGAVPGTEAEGSQPAS